VKEAHTWGAIDINLEEGELGLDVGRLLWGRLLVIRPKFQEFAQYSLFNCLLHQFFDADSVLDKAPYRVAAGTAAG